MIVSLVKGLVAGLGGVVEQATSGRDTSTAIRRSETELRDNFLCLQPMNEPNSCYDF